jgi:hypothetical protein
MGELRGNEAMFLEDRSKALPWVDPRAEAFLCGGKCPFANRFHMGISNELRFTQGEFTAALCRKFGLHIPQLFSDVGVQLSNNANSARKVGDAFGSA